MNISKRITAPASLPLHRPRKGTKCKCCEKTLAEGEMAYNVKTPTCPSAYICQFCADVHNTPEDIPVDFRGLATKKGSLTAILWRSEAMPSLETRVYLAAAYRVNFIKQGKVYRAVPKTALSLHGSKDIFRGMEGFCPEGCQTVSIGKIGWENADFQRIKEASPAIFADLFKYFSENQEEFQEFFGQSWCRPNFLKLDPVPQFAFPYGDANTFFHKVSFVENVSGFLADFLSGKFTAEKTAKRILNKFIEYANGENQTQRPERNKGWVA